MVLSAANALPLAGVAAIKGFSPSVVSLASADAVCLLKADVPQPITSPVQSAETHQDAFHNL